LQVREIVVTSVSMFVFSLYMIACAYFMSPQQASLFFKVSTPDVGGLAASSGPSPLGTRTIAEH
jgi:hypothetical protein